MSNNLSTVLGTSENLCKFHCRAKYIPQPDGALKLSQVQKMSRAVFGEEGWEESGEHSSVEDLNIIDEEGSNIPTDPEGNARRAMRRAKVNAFDYILCNPELDTFATFTYDPKRINDRGAYDECYEALKPWLSNRVQRRGLLYVLTPEYHEKGGIHWHMICNSSALSLARATSAKSGRELTHNGNPLYNVSDWAYGFTSAEVIRAGENDREAVAKYIFKYMGKQKGQKIGGRYFLHGGKLRTPVYIYGSTPEELCDPSTAKHTRTVEAEGVTYHEWSFI